MRGGKGSWGAFVATLAKLVVCTIVYFVGVSAGAESAALFRLAMPAVPAGVDPRVMLASSAAGGFFVVVAQALLARDLSGGFISRWFILAVLSYVCVGPNTAIESAIFTRLGGTATMVVVMILPCFLSAAATAVLFGPKHPGARLSIGQFLTPTVGAKVRLALAWISFPIIYFIFGVCVSPIVAPYYLSGQAGLVLPSLPTIVQVQLVRSALYVLAVLPVLAAWSASRMRLVTSLGLALFLLVGLNGLVQAHRMPLVLRVVHGLEILADSMVHAVALVILLGPVVRRAS